MNIGPAIGCGELMCFDNCQSALIRYHDCSEEVGFSGLTTSRDLLGICNVSYNGLHVRQRIHTLEMTQLQIVPKSTKERKRVTVFFLLSRVGQDLTAI